jgi:hypothetical protein
VADAMGAVNEREDPFTATGFGEVFERHAYTWERTDGIEDGDTGSLAFGASGMDDVLEELDKICVFKWKGELNSSALHEAFGELRNVLDGFTTGTIDGGEIYDLILSVLVPDDITEDCIHTRCGIWHKYGSIYRSIEKLSNGLAGLIQELGIFIANEWIRSQLALILKVSELIPYISRKCAKGACQLSVQVT